MEPDIAAQFKYLQEALEATNERLAGAEAKISAQEEKISSQEEKISAQEEEDHRSARGNPTTEGLEGELGDIYNATGAHTSLFEEVEVSDAGWGAFRSWACCEGVHGKPVTKMRTRHLGARCS